MLKKIWNLLGSLKLTFWTLNLITVTFVAGVFYSKYDYVFFESMNNAKFQEWLFTQGIASPELS